MRVGKQHPAFGQSINIGRAHLRMPLEATDPVVQVINGNEKHVGLDGGPAGGGKSHAKYGVQNSHGGDASSRPGNAPARKSNALATPGNGSVGQRNAIAGLGGAVAISGDHSPNVD